MSEKKYPIDFLGKWMEALIEAVDELTDEKTKKEIMEKCGKACALYYEDIEKIKAKKRRGRNVEEILDEMNREGMWCSEWIKEGDTVYSICKKCGCPLVKSKIIKPSPAFCYCSLGWAKSIFEIVFEKPVQVEQKKAIGRGDDVCHFVVNII